MHLIRIFACVTQEEIKKVTEVDVEALIFVDNAQELRMCLENADTYCT
jgi:hypothetical protein